ncbi:MAG: DHA2 family efflux MFS transporter permease subunit [Methanoregula sp.]|nr:DHA2 family efflux MFS transporter permease subunit [Methanoregula sp.]
MLRSVSAGCGQPLNLPLSKIVSECAMNEKIPAEGGKVSNVSPFCHRYAVLFIVLVSVLMAVIDGTVVNIALPSMTRFFAVDLSDSQWTITAYLITMTSLLLVFGKVSEYVGRARLFFVGILIFTASSLACGLSTGLPELILFRVIQGAGAAMLFSISSALIFATTPPAERGRAMGYIGATVAIGSIAGPVVGGFVVDSLGWQYIFFINIPIGILLIAAAAQYLRIDEKRTASLSLDWHGSVAMIVMFVALIIALGSFADNGVITLTAIFSGAVSILALALFIRHERRCPAPLLDLSVFSYGAFLFPVIAVLLAFVANFMMAVVGPFYFEGVLEYRPSQVGLVFLVSPVVMVIVAPIAGSLYDRHPTRNYAALGMGITTIAFLLLSYCALTRYLPGIIIAFVLFGTGFGLFQSPNNTAIMSALPSEQLSTASSVIATSRNLGMALGVSLGSILLSFQLLAAGYGGDVIAADPTLLAVSISRIMAVSAVLCVFVVLLSSLKR